MGRAQKTVKHLRQTGPGNYTHYKNGKQAQSAKMVKSVKWKMVKPAGAPENGNDVTTDRPETWQNGKTVNQ